MGPAFNKGSSLLKMHGAPFSTALFIMYYTTRTKPSMHIACLEIIQKNPVLGLSHFQGEQLHLKATIGKMHGACERNTKYIVK